jgi:signal-transduction protein with cAMP-binding, CBS, and nucleotidyltransferase domain
MYMPISILAARAHRLHDSTAGSVAAEATAAPRRMPTGSREEGREMSLKKYCKAVGCMSPRASIVEASQAMKARAIGAIVVVSDDHKPIGLLTDRDITLNVIAEGKNPQQTTVEEVMSSGIISLPEQASIEQATELMRDHGVRRIQITDDKGYVTGLISLDDILLLVGLELGNVAAALFKEFADSDKRKQAGGVTGRAPA